MNYKVKMKVTNCDSQLGHPQAVDASFEEEIQLMAQTQEGAEAAAQLRLQKRYPKCTVEIVQCSEAPLTPNEGEGCNVFDPADLKNQDTTERARES